ncbi:MAG: COG4705 family protein [Actinoallomurus sp.]
MTTDTQRYAAMPRTRQRLNKVPEVTIYFWIIQILCTTVGETAADFLNTNLKLGLTKTTLVMSASLIATMVFQFRAKKYVPGVYWLTVVLISIVGTLITDNLTDNLGVALETTTALFAVALVVTFAAWFASERTLSIHTIYTVRREAFYWATILFTFALGTAAGDLVSEKLSLGYLVAAAIFGGLIAIVAFSHLGFKVNAILAFWIAYILTRPFGASIGDYLSQAPGDGGLGLGTVVTSALFLVTILVLVVYLAVTRKDETAPNRKDGNGRHALS